MPFSVSFSALICESERCSNDIAKSANRKEDWRPQTQFRIRLGSHRRSNREQWTPLLEAWTQIGDPQASFQHQPSNIIDDEQRSTGLYLSRHLLFQYSNILEMMNYFPTSVSLKDNVNQTSITEAKFVFCELRNASVHCLSLNTFSLHPLIYSFHHTRKVDTNDSDHLKECEE